MRKLRKKQRAKTVFPSDMTRKLLRAVPQRNRTMELIRKRDGSARLEVPLDADRRGKLARSLKPRASTRKIDLDPLGLKVLELCDERRSVEAIIEDFATENRLSFREGQLPVVQFLQLLAYRGVVAVVSEEDKR